MSPASTPTPTAPAPTATPPAPTATPIPPLGIDPGPLTAGQSFTLGIALIQNITRPFDFYLFAETPAGIYTIYLNGKTRKGIIPLYKNVPKFNAPYFKTVSPAVKIPASMKGKTITFYILATDAGKKPPVKKPSDITPTSPNVIMFDKRARTVN
jgi:hypothetical protein